MVLKEKKKKNIYIYKFFETGNDPKKNIQMPFDFRERRV